MCYNGYIYIIKMLFWLKTKKGNATPFEVTLPKTTP
jgi:hypothetical protein